MRKVFKKALAVTMAATMVVGLAACGSSESSDKGASNQIRLKSEFQSGHQQMYLDHSVKRCWTKQQRHWT